MSERQANARRRLAALERDYRALGSGTGRWHGTVEGAAARNRHEANGRLDQARRTGRDPNSRWRDRRAATKALPGLAAAAAAAGQRWSAVGKPAADKLQSHVRAARRELDRLDIEASVQRLDSLQERTPGRGIDGDLGMSP